VAKRPAAPKAPKHVEALRHTEDKRRNIPTAEHQSVLEAEHTAPREVRYPRNPDIDPQLVWRGKDYQDSSDLVVQAPPLYIQEKVHPKVLIDDLLRESEGANALKAGAQFDLFGDFNGVAEGADRTDFYQHDQNWTNRMILGDSLQVMASLAEREGLRGKVQCIYIDPPYGIRFNSNFQWSTTSREVKDGNTAHITREPEQVKAFRDTWRDGIHSYLTYLRDRLVAARDLLTETGSIFVQIGDENVHRVRALLDEVFGDTNCIAEILVKKKGSQKGGSLEAVNDFVLWYSKSQKASGTLKFRPLYELRDSSELVEDFPFVELENGARMRLAQLALLDGRDYLSEPSTLALSRPGARLFAANPLKSGGHRRKQSIDMVFQGRVFSIKTEQSWKHTVIEDDATTPGMTRLARADRLLPQDTDVRFVRHSPTPSIREISNWWDGFGGAPNQVYVVQTNERIVQRCILMATDPGDLVVDPTCGSGTTAYVAEQWGRRWITIDTSRVALALARARIMGARYPYYVLADSPEGLRKYAEIGGRAFADKPTYGNVRQGFVYERAMNVTSASIANNAEIDVLYDEHQPQVRGALEVLNASLRGHSTPFRVTVGGREGKAVSFESRNADTFTMPSGEIVPASELVEWEVPREAPGDWPMEAKRALSAFWDARIARQRAIDASIAAKADFEYLFDRPFEDKKTVRVAGPFTVESLSPHRTLGVDENDELIDPFEARERFGGASSPIVGQTFEQMILENLRAAGVQQAHKADRITFSSLGPWPGDMISAEGRYREGGGDSEKRAAIFIGPEFGTVQRPDLVRAAREAGDAGFDVLIACAFNYEAHASEFSKLGRVPVLKARMNADLQMGGELKATGKGNLFVIFGEPDIDILHVDDGTLRVHVKGVDVFDPTSGEVRSDGAEGIACWFIDTDYNEESFFVRHAYFLGQNDPYGALKTTLHAEIDADSWATLNSDISRPFPKPKTGRIAVKVINHLGDEVMKLFRVE
jgi:adenine-specific DNA-methyltransferase